MTANFDRTLPEGARLVELSTHGDERGALTEVYREEWIPEGRSVQWNFVHSRAGTMRGVHVHLNRVDYLVLTGGTMLLGLCDLRPDSVTFRQSTLVTLSSETNVAAYIPSGVAHGFYFPEPSTTLYGLSAYYSLSEELGCYPGDPALGIPWPAGDWLLSERDQSAGTFEEMQLAYDRLKTG